MTDVCAWFLAGRAKRLSWREVAEGFHRSWDTVYQSVRMAAALEVTLYHTVGDLPEIELTHRFC